MTTLTALRFDVTCRRCGGELTIVNPGAHTEIESKAVVACPKCKREYLILVRLEPSGPPMLDVQRRPPTIVPKDLRCPTSGVNASCGTDCGYRKGCREEACRAAHNDAEKDRIARRAKARVA